MWPWPHGTGMTGGGSHARKRRVFPVGTASIMRKLVCFHMFAHGRPPGQHRRRARAPAKCIKTHRFLQGAGSSHGENLGGGGGYVARADSVRPLPRRMAPRAISRGPGGSEYESHNTLDTNAIKRTLKRSKNTSCSVRLRHPPHRAPSATAARQRCTARGRSMGQKQLCIVGPVPSAWMCARSAPSSSLSRRSKRNINSANAQTTLRDTDVEHERTQTAQRWHTLCGRRRTRFVGSAAAYAMTSTHHYVMLRPAKASYACKRGLRRVKASYGPAINYV